MKKASIFKAFRILFSFKKIHHLFFRGEVSFYTNKLDLNLKMKNYVIYSLIKPKSSKKQYFLRR